MAPPPHPISVVPAAADADPDARIGDTPTVLHALAEQGASIALWRRDPEPALAGALQCLAPGPFPEIRAALGPGSSAPEIAARLAAQRAAQLAPKLSGLPAAKGTALAGLAPWIDDLSRICEVYCRLVGDLVEPGPLTLRLETLSDDGCRRFHVDRSRLRLLCTYRGPGTQWLTQGQVDRPALEAHGPNERVLRWGEPRAVEPLWVAVMKGERFPGNAGRGLVHRSPPIAGTGHCRVLFCLDT